MPSSRSSTRTPHHRVHRSRTCGKAFDRASVLLAERVIPPTRPAKKEWISENTLHIVNMRREARLAGDTKKYRALNTARRRSLRHDRQEWANGMASEGEALLEKNNLQGAFNLCQEAQGWRPENHCSHQGYQRLSSLGPPSYAGKMEKILQRPPEQTACSVLAVDRC